MERLLPRTDNTDNLTEDEAASVYIASGSAHPEFTEAVAGSIGIEPGLILRKQHPNGELYARFGESVRGKGVFIVQPHIRASGMSPNDAIMEQCLMADAARSSSASEITAVAPYLGYGRQDRKSKGREPIGARVVLDQLAVAGVSRIITVDMHSPQAQGIFRGPFDHLTAQPLLRQAMAEEVAGRDLEGCVIVAPDAGAAKMAEQHQSRLDMDMFVMSKMRDPRDSQKINRRDRFPEVDGRTALLFDDMVDTAGTLVSAAEALSNSGAQEIYVAATHGILSDPAIERIKDSPITKVLVTDTHDMSVAQAELGDTLRVVSAAPMVGRAIMTIIRNGSVSELFDDQNHR